MNLKEALEELTAKFDRYRWSVDTTTDTLLIGEGPDNTVSIVCSDSGQAQLLLRLISNIEILSEEYDDNLRDIELMDEELDTVGGYLQNYHPRSSYPRGEDPYLIKDWIEEVLEDQRDHLRDDLDAVYCDNDALRDELDAVTERNSDLEAENENLRETVEDLQRRLEELEEELSELRASTRDNLQAST